MVRTPMILVALLTATAVFAQADAPEGDRNRYQFTRVEDGYLRLDQRTGQVSFCNRREAGWSCQTVADDRAAFEQEIGRLQNENVALKKELIARGVPLPGGIRPAEPGAKGTEGDLKSPGNADVDRMMSTVERVWRRLLEMIGSLHKEMMKKT